MPGWATWILEKGLPIVLGWFGYKKDVAGPSAEQKVGKLEAENESLRNYVDVERRTADARTDVVDDPGVVYNDPDNRRDPPPSSVPGPGGS